MTARIPLLLIGALLVGLMARMPGVWWGDNFPFGWHSHHPDEYTHSLHAQLLINYNQPAYSDERSQTYGLSDPWSAGWPVTPYPKGLAIHVAAPVKATRLLTGNTDAPPPDSAGIIPYGRMVVALYGTATILLLYLLAMQVYQHRGMALAAAWLLALGGLHVAQSHFFVAGVPALFWTMLGLLLLWMDLASAGRNRLAVFTAAAVCFGIAFGLKLVVATLPTLGLAALMKPNRLLRVAISGIAFVGGLLLVNLGTYTPLDFFDTLRTGVSDPWTFSKLEGARLYLLELPLVLGLPFCLATLFAGLALGARFVRMQQSARQLRIGVVLLLPVIVHLVIMLVRLDPFPRHLLMAIPLFAMVAAWGLLRLMDAVPAGSRWVVPAIVFGWQALYVYDGEKGFIMEPRNEAARWLQENVGTDRTLWWYYHRPPGYTRILYPGERPDVVMEEMHHANHFLSGLGMRNSMPRDYRHIFDSKSQENVDGIQALFTGESEYREVARFGENYFMPEYVLTDRYLGNRSGNYLAEVVVFVNSASWPAFFQASPEPSK